MLIDRNRIRAERAPQLGVARLQDPYEVIALIIDELRKDRQDLIRQAIRDGRSEAIVPAIKQVLAQNAYSVEGMTTEELQQAVLDHMIGYGPAEQWLEHPEFVGWFVNDYDDVWVQLGRKMVRLETGFGTAENVRRYIERITGNLTGEINEDNPVGKFFDAGRNLRIIVAYPPIAYICPTVVIRKQPKNPWTLDGLVECGTLNKAMADDLRSYAASGANITITGIPGSGKTTVLRAVAEQVPETERMLVMEDHPELEIRRRNTVHWLTKKLSKGQRVDLEQLTNYGLMGSFSYYVFGEIRDGDAFYFFNGAFAGNRTLNTGHAQACKESLERLRINMKMAGVPMGDQDLMEILYKSIDVIVYMNNFRVIEIAEVNEATREIKTLWEYTPARKNQWTRSGKVEAPKLRIKLAGRDAHGAVTDSSPDNAVDSTCG